MKVVTAVVNNPLFIELQYYTLKKYMLSDYEFIVFNDAKFFPDFTNGNDITIKKQIEETCNRLNIKCINIPNENHLIIDSSCTRCADSVNYILKYQINNPDKYLVIDSDMFLVDYFNINKYENFECAIVLQYNEPEKINYFWNGIYYFDINKMKNLNLLNWNCYENTDVGGMMKEWLKKQSNDFYPNVKNIRWKNENYDINYIHYMKHLWSCTWDESEFPENIKKTHPELLDFMKNDPRNIDGKFFCEIYENVFLHYRAGGNWRREGLDLHFYLSKILKNTIINNSSFSENLNMVVNNEKKELNRPEQLKKIQNSALEVFIKKNSDYGDAFAKFGLIGILVRLEDKIQRSITITKNGINLVNDEGLKDTLLDLHNYAAMGLMLLDENKQI